MELSPTELHYYKRELIRLELLDEFDRIRRDPTRELQTFKEQPDTYPFLWYIAREFVLEFPLLKRGNNKDKLMENCVEFVREFSKVKLDTYSPRKTGASQRRVLMYKMEKLITVALCAAVKTVQGEDQAIHPVKDARRNEQDEALAESMDKNMTLLENEDHYLEWLGFNGLHINVVTVRQVSEKRTLREKTHAEFVLVTNISGQDEPHIVARRHGDFRQLQQNLKTEFPTEDVPNVPSKASDPSYEKAKGEQEEKPAEEKRSKSSSSLLGSSGSFHRPHFRRRSHSNANNQLYREKDRLLLRSFLHRVATDPVLAKSDTFRKFLTKDPITLTADEKADADRRDQIDQARIAEETKFKEEVDRKMAELNDLLDMLKKQILQPGGLMQVFDIIKTTERIEDLPDALRKAFEWGRINFAFVLHTQFVSSDRSAENIANLKRTHMLMPYRAVGQLLKLSNPFTMVKGVLDLFLAQPLGRKSLLQRIIVNTMRDGDEEIQQDITDLEAKIAVPALVTKVKNAVVTPMPDSQLKQRLYSRRTDATEETLTMLRSSDIEPVLTDAQIPKKDATELLNQIHRLWTLYARQREHQLLGDLVFQGSTAELLREMFAFFYEPLAEVYRAANIGESFKHLSAFIDDLIGVIDSVNVVDARNTAQPFIQLVQRHEQQFYTFVHNVHANDKSHLFDELLGYVDRVFALVSTGIKDRVDLEAIAAEALTADERTVLRKDVDALCDYHWKRKEQHMKRRRQKLMMEDEAQAFDFLPNNTEMMGLIDDLVEFEDDDDDSDDEVPEHEMLIEPPNLQVLPKVYPIFANHVAKTMRS
ncbi:hypothetical protein BJV82DRAFT_642654 [Fennellomyces sp. T-0311]|nr:hypothetical protein BJV82DRAFT_642654 [Fennellomyces sp. T-0311]